jgi:hypothetical protein
VARYGREVTTLAEARREFARRTHFLIHTAYRPRSPYYRAIWRNHRLHHFKNEHFWHGITNNISDRVLGTNPDQRSVPRSLTARTLDPGPVG